MSRLDEVRHDDKAWELRQKWIDLMNEAVNIDEESKGVGRLERSKMKFIPLEELFALDELSDKSRQKHMEKDQAYHEYFSYLKYLKSIQSK